MYGDLQLSGASETLTGPDGQPIPPDSPQLPHVYSFAGLINTAARTYSWRWDEAYRTSRENAMAMRRDAFLMGLLRERQFPVEQADWHIEPEDPLDSVQVQEATYLQKLVKAIPNFTRYRRSCLEALWYGRSGTYHDLDWTEVGGFPAYTVSDHWNLNGDKVQFHWDGTPCILIYSAAARYLEEQGATIVYTDRNVAMTLDGAWRDKFTVHKHDCIDGDFFESFTAGQIHGVGIRHWVYWTWWLRAEVMSWMTDFLERTGLGLTIYFYEEGNPQSLAQAQAAAKQDGRNTVIVWPRSPQGKDAGAGIERMETQVHGAEFILECVKYFDDKLERFITGEAILSSQGKTKHTGGGDTSALFSTAKFEKLRDDANNLDETLTRDLVNLLQRQNMPGVLHRHRFVTDLPDPKAKEKLENLKVAYEMGIAIKEDEAYKLLGFSRPNEGDAVIQQQFQPAMVPGMEGEQPPGEDPNENGQSQESGNGEGFGYERLFTYAIDKKLWSECKEVVPSSVPDSLPHKCGTIDGDVEVFLVDGNKIKLQSRKGKAKSKRGDNDFMDFVEGGNGVEDPGLCGKKEIFLDANINPDDWKYILYHEAQERRDMLEGMSYDEAHTRANRSEKQLRLESASEFPLASGNGRHA